MFVRLFGVAAIGHDQTDAVDVPSAVARPVLASIALAAGRAVDLDQIAQAVWDDPPASARNAIQVAVSRLRATFGREVVETVVGGYRLGSPLARVDLLEVESLAGDARRHWEARRPLEALAACEGLLSLAVDQPLTGHDTEWAHEIRGRAAERVVEARLIRAQAWSSLGRAGDAIPELAEIARDRRLDEAVIIAYMTALTAAGHQADALRAYDGLRVALSEELGVDPSADAQAAFRELLNPSLSTPLEIVPVVRLPRPAGPTWGRDDTQEAIVEALRGGHRLVSLLGAGGIGKTRTAVVAARKVAERDAWSAWFIDLTTATGEQSVEAALNSGIDPSGSDYESVLRRGIHLIVLDNAEHVATAVAEIVPRLLTMGDVRILATSRVPLNVPDERPIWIETLNADGPDSAAVQLLLDRSSSWVDRRAVPLDKFTALARRVDGVPLALELLAACMRWLTPEDLLNNVDRELRTMAPGAGRAQRHYSVSAAIEWNVAQLDDDARAALGALLAIRGHFSTGAAESVITAVAPTRAPRELLTALIDLSLVQRLPGAGEVRLQILAPIRMAAEEHPNIVAADQAARMAHARYYLGSARNAVDVLDATDLPVVNLHRLDDWNITAALEWAWAYDRPFATDCLGHVMYYWYYVIRSDQMQRWVEELDHVRDRAARARCAVALFKRDVMFARTDDAKQWRAMAEPYVSQLDPEWQARWWFGVGEELRLSGEFEKAIATMRNAPQSGTPRSKATLANAIGICLLSSGEYARALVYLREALALQNALEQPSLYIYLLVNCAYTEMILGERDHPAKLISQALELARATKVRDDYVLATNTLAWLALQQGSPIDALSAVASSADTLGQADDLYFAAEISLIGALALEALDARSDCASAVSALRSFLEEAPAGLLDKWSRPQAKALLERWPPAQSASSSFGDLSSLFEHAARREAKLM